jgi:hypothetical protein
MGIELFGRSDRSVHERLDNVEAEIERLWGEVGNPKAENATPSQAEESSSASDSSTSTEAPAE